MKKFTFHLILFFILFILISCAFDIFFSMNLKKSNSYADGEYSVWNDLYNGEINSDIVIYGSSNAWVEIDPGIISDRLGVSAYNLGINGHNFGLQYFRHSILLKFNRSPKLIIHTINAATFQKAEDLYNPDQFLPYMLKNEEMKNALIRYNGYKIIDFHLPLIRYYGKKKAILHSLYLILNPSSNVIMRLKGYQGKNKPWTDDLKKAKEENQYLEFKLDTSLIYLFENYYNECKKNNIRIILVTPPEFIEGQEFVRNRPELMALNHKLSQKLDIPFFDYSNDTMSFQKKYFYNSGHLNITGAELFTNKLIDDLKKYQINNGLGF